MSSVGRAGQRLNGFLSSVTRSADAVTFQSAKLLPRLGRSLPFGVGRASNDDGDNDGAIPPWSVRQASKQASPASQQESSGREKKQKREARGARRRGGGGAGAMISFVPRLDSCWSCTSVQHSDSLHARRLDALPTYGGREAPHRGWLARRVFDEQDPLSFPRRLPPLHQISAIPSSPSSRASPLLPAPATSSLPVGACCTYSITVALQGGARCVKITHAIGFPPHHYRKKSPRPAFCPHLHVRPDWLFRHAMRVAQATLVDALKAFAFASLHLCSSVSTHRRAASTAPIEMPLHGMTSRSNRVSCAPALVFLALQRPSGSVFVGPKEHGSARSAPTSHNARTAPHRIASQHYCSGPLEPTGSRVLGSCCCCYNAIGGHRIGWSRLLSRLLVSAESRPVRTKASPRVVLPSPSRHAYASAPHPAPLPNVNSQKSKCCRGQLHRLPLVLPLHHRATHYTCDKIANVDNAANGAPPALPPSAHVQQQLSVAPRDRATLPLRPLRR